MKRVLIIQYFYKPIISNQSFRYDRILENFDDDIEIDILTSHHHGLEITEKLKNITVYRANHRFLKKKIPLNATNTAQTSNGNVSQLKKIISIIVRKLMWPDFAFLWIIPAYTQGKKLINEKKYDMVFTVSFPFSSHLIGYLLKKKNKQLPWTVDYIDPFSIINSGENPANNVKIYRRLNRWIENRVNISADRIFLLEEAHKRFLKVFPHLKRKATIIHPMLGIEQKKYEETIPYKFNNSGINIVYTGTFYKSIRNPEKFLVLFDECLKIDKNIYLHFVGDLKDCESIVSQYYKKHPNNIFLYGKVNREETMMYLKGSDVLLNIANSSFTQLPGKVVEYLYSGKKIINFTPNSKSNSSVFFQKYAANKQVLEVIDNNYCIEEILNFIYSNQEVKNVDIEKFLPENISKLYL